ncbi:MAG: hypothetical protein V7746_01985 [Halioglobus sp.]
MYKRLHSLDYLRGILMSGGIVLHGVQMYMTMHLGFDYYNDYSPRARYFSDSSYWVFLVHQPLLLLFAIPLFWWDVPAGVKFSLVALATLVTSLVSYAYLVRGTRLGKLL